MGMARMCHQPRPENGSGCASIGGKRTPAQNCHWLAHRSRTTDVTARNALSLDGATSPTAATFYRLKKIRTAP